MMNKDPIEVLFGQYRRELLGLLLLRPDESFHTRELARLTGIPVGSLTRELKGLLEGGIVLREKQGNQVRYQADRRSPVFEELSGLFRKTSGLAYVLRDALEPKWDEIEVALVFGSIAKGMAKSSSDVDVFVISELGLREMVELLYPLQERLRREINPVVMSRTAFVAGREKHDRFLERLMEEPKIFVKGTRDDLEKPA